MIAAVKWGALVGVASYVVLDIGLTLLNLLLFGTSPTDLNHPGPLSLACLGIFAVLFAFSAAGYFTGRETLKAGWGAASAMVALAVYYVLKAIYTPGASVSSNSSEKLPAIAQVLSATAAAIIVLLIAAFMGWLGARPAIQRAGKRLEQARLQGNGATASARDGTANPQ